MPTYAFSVLLAVFFITAGAESAGDNLGMSTSQTALSEKLDSVRLPAETAGGHARKNPKVELDLSLKESNTGEVASKESNPADLLGRDDQGGEVTSNRQLLSARRRRRTNKAISRFAHQQVLANT